MKFSQIRTGQQFIWNGEAYVKQTPLIASHLETGKSKMVPKYVSVEPVDGESETSAIKGPEDVLEYVMNELSLSVMASTLSDAAKQLVLDEIKRLKKDVSEKIN